MNNEYLRRKAFEEYMKMAHVQMQQQEEFIKQEFLDAEAERLNNSLYHELLELNNNDM